MDVESRLSEEQLCSLWSSSGKTGAHESAVEPLCNCQLCPSCCWRVQPQAPGRDWCLGFGSCEMSQRVLCPFLGASGQGWHTAAIQQRDSEMIRRMEHIIDKKWICEKKAKRSYYCCLLLPNETVQGRQSQAVLKSDRSCRGRMISNKLDKLEHRELQLGANKNILPLGWSNIETDCP